jgi:cell shape-determining protein MreC
MLRFTHIFTLLLIMAAIGAFVVPVGTGDGARAVVAGVFAPVSWPARAAAGWVHDSVRGNRPVDDVVAGGARARTVDQLRGENEALRLTVANLSSQLASLKQLNADRQMLGDVRPLCDPFPVVGTDSGPRRALILQTLGRAGGGAVAQGQPALYSGGIAGRVEQAGAGSAIVRLVTDKDFRLTGGFGRFKHDQKGHVVFEKLEMSHSQPPLLEGTGRGTMRIENVDMKDAQASHLAAGDWVVLADHDWPLQLQGYKLGQIVSVETRPSAPLFALIEVRPVRDLMELREVMVMNKE